MMSRIVFLASVVTPMFASTAFADELGAPASKARLGAQLELLPVGSLDVEAGNTSISEDAKLAYGVGVTFDYDLTPNISVGLAPRMIFHIVGKDAGGDAANQLDLRARITAHAPVANKLSIYGFVAPGYSIIMAPSDDGDAELDDPKGLVVAFGAGATYDLAPKVFLSGEVGYQLGFQGTEVLGESVDVSTDFLHIGLGAGLRF